MQHKEPIPSITSARPGRSVDADARTRRYLIMMGIRIACLPLAVLSSGLLRWAFIAGAVILPYFAVVIANATEKRRGSGLPQAVVPDFGPSEHPALEAGPRVPEAIRLDAIRPDSVRQGFGEDRPRHDGSYPSSGT